MRTVTVENNQIVLRIDGMPIRYSLRIVQKRVKELAAELETWKEYERLLTPLALDEANEPLCVCGKPISRHNGVACLPEPPRQ